MSIKNYEEELQEEKIYKQLKIEQEKIKLLILKEKLKEIEQKNYTY